MKAVGVLSDVPCPIDSAHHPVDAGEAIELLHRQQQNLQIEAAEANGLNSTAVSVARQRAGKELESKPTVLIEKTATPSGRKTIFDILNEAFRGIGGFENSSIGNLEKAKITPNVLDADRAIEIIDLEGVSPVHVADEIAAVDLMEEFEDPLPRLMQNRNQGGDIDVMEIDLDETEEGEIRQTERAPDDFESLIDLLMDATSATTKRCRDVIQKLLNETEKMVRSARPEAIDIEVAINQFLGEIRKETQMSEQETPGGRDESL